MTASWSAPGAARVVLASLPMLLWTAGCDLVVAPTVAPPPTMPVVWSTTPLPMDPAMAAAAERAGSTCQQANQPVRVVVGDRRTAGVAAFILENATRLDSCIFTFVDGRIAAGGASDGEVVGPAGPLTAEVSMGSHIDGVGDVRLLGGRVVEGAASVQVSLADGRFLTASIAAGWWLASWPGTAGVTRAVAFDASGAVIATVEQPK
jgi:hypothetical protein